VDLLAFGGHGRDREGGSLRKRKGLKKIWPVEKRGGLFVSQQRAREEKISLVGGGEAVYCLLF